MLMKLPGASEGFIKQMSKHKEGKKGQYAGVEPREMVRQKKIK